MEKIRKCIIGGIEYWHTEALRLRAENTDLRNANQILRDALEAERAELAECRQDAEHFIWLANELGLCIMTMNADPSYFAEDDGDAVTAWRKAIDAARKGEGE